MRTICRIGLAIAALLPACADSGGASGLHGPTVAIDVAALNLPGVGDVVWDIEVDDVGGAAVWQRRITSTSHGDSAGSASYVGPCDADSAANPNLVKVWVVGVYAADVTLADAGAFASGDASSVTGTALRFQNPTGPTTPLTRSVTCAPNTDTAVAFDVALMRPAEQGFFDIGVSFNDVFCSAKLDCCADATGDGCASDGSEDIDLLFDADGDRARTIVLGFACTAGTASGVVTELYMDDLTLDCSAPNTGTDFAAELTIDPDATSNGNLCTAGADGMTSCAPLITESGRDADTVLFQVATYRGEEPLTTGGSPAHKVYWNVALGVKDGISACRLRAQATADDAANTDDHVDGGVIDAGTVYPYVAWDVDLGTCGSEALTFGDASAPVAAAYTGVDDAATSFAHSYSPVFVGADGATAEAAITSCDALLTANPAATSGSYWIDPDGVGTGADAFYGYCEMAADGGWTLIMRGGSDMPTRATWNTTTEYAVATAASDGTQDGPTFKLADATINAFTGTYRVRTGGILASTRYLPATCSYAHTANPSAECRYTCSDVGLTDCLQGGVNGYAYGMQGGVTYAAEACGIMYFATSTAPVYMTTPTSTYNVYWMVQVGTSAAGNANCHYGPGQRWYSSSVNDDGTITVWRR